MLNHCQQLSVAAVRCQPSGVVAAERNTGDNHAIRSDREAAFGQGLVDVDKLTHAIPEGEGSRLFLGAQHIDMPHSLSELENVLAGRERTDIGQSSSAGFGVR